MPRLSGAGGWTLPEVVHPTKTRCFTIEVPDDREYIAAFRGALLDLASAYNWANDSAHTAREVALVWRDIIEQVDRCLVAREPKGGIINEDIMPIRVDCDCNVFVTCCDGTEVQLATKAMLNQPGVPGAGTPQPGPNGGVQEYPGCISANQVWPLPAPVSSGDIIDLSGATGSAFDGGFGNVTWHCPDGSVFFAGACLGGTGSISGSDPMPAVKHMKLILFLDGTYYDILDAPFTVPGGVDNVLGFLQLNDDNITDNSGQECFSLAITNNQAGRWIHRWLGGKGTAFMDLPPQTQIWGSYSTSLDRILSEDSGAGTAENASVDIDAVMDITQVDFDVLYDNDGPLGSAGSGLATDANNPGTQNLYSVLTPVGVGVLHVTWIGTQHISQRLRFFASSIKTVVGSTAITNIVVQGTGISPFGADN